MPGPGAGSVCHWLPSLVITWARPLAAVSSATIWLPVWESRITVMGWRPGAAGIAGPVACHAPQVPGKMPAVPRREHVPASSGTPEGV